MGDRLFNISITSGTVVKTIVILALAALLYKILDVVLIVLVAITIASSIEPGIAGLVKRRIPRILAVILIYLSMFGLFFVLFYFFLPSVLEDFATFISQLPTYLESFTRSGAFNTYSAILGLPAPSEASSAEMMAGIRGFFDLGTVFGNPIAAASAIFGSFLSLMLVVIFSFYFAVIDTGVDDFLRIITPKSHREYILGLWKRSQKKIGLWMQGQLILAVIIGVLVFLGLTIIGVPHALVLAVIAGCFELIPVFGPTLSAVPAVIIGFVYGGPLIGLVVIGLYVVLQQFENHLIYPLVVTRVVGVSPILVILALIVGGTLFGFAGIILSVPAAAVLQEFVRDMQAGRLPGQQEA